MRQLSRPYLQHGRRHGPQGSDPIPGAKFSPLDFMLAYGTITDSSSSPSYIDLDLWVTSNEDIFTLQTGTGGLASTHAVAIHEEGIYRTWSKWLVDSGTNGDVLITDLDIRATGVSFWNFANTQNIPQNQVTLSTSSGGAQVIEVANLIYVGGPLQVGPVVLPALIFSTTLSQGSHTYHIEFETLVERIATDYTTNGSPGTAP